MVQDDPVAQLRHDPLVPPSGGEHFHAPLMLRAPPLVDQIAGRKVWLPCEDVHYRLRRIRLEFLVFELEFHLLSSKRGAVSTVARNT